MLLLQAEVAMLAAAYQGKQAQLELFQSEKARLEEDLDVPLRLRQGQLEVEPQGIVDGSLDHAVLISEALIRVCCWACFAAWVSPDPC